MQTFKSSVNTKRLIRIHIHLLGLYFMSAIANDTAVLGEVGSNTPADASASTQGAAGSDSSAEISSDPRGDLQQKTSDFFNSVLELAKEETSQTSQELSVLEQMNNLATSEYAQIEDTVKSLGSFQKDVKKKQDLLAGYIDEIDKLDKTTLELEHVVGILDEYTKRIEAKAKQYI